jgi:carbon-monoxide dehydrogenase large subunit
VAETHEQAKDAAELIEVDYKTLPAVVASDVAIRPGSPQLFEVAPGNLCFDWHLGDKAAVDAAFSRAHHVTRLELVNNRLVSNPMEPRAAIGDYDRATGDYTLYTTSQAPHVHRLLIGAFVLQIPEHKLRVIAPDVGGGFGTKGSIYPEQALVLWAAQKLSRPVKWAADRGEIFLTDNQARDHLTKAELALDKDGKFIGLRVATLANLGPISAPLRRQSRLGAMARCSLATMQRLPSTSRSRASSPTLRRSMPIAAPDGRKRPMSSNVWSIARRAR